MRTAVGLEDGLGLDGDQCMRDTPTVMLYSFQQNPKSKSQLIHLSINTCHDSSVGKAWDCKHKKWESSQ